MDISLIAALAMALALGIATIHARSVNNENRDVVALGASALASAIGAVVALIY